MSADDRRLRRQEKTREAILHAFTRLLLERGYDEITVVDVIAYADIGRSTFYEHFPTKLDLLKSTLVTPFTPLADAVNDVPMTNLIGWLRHFRENHALGRILFAGATRKLLLRTLADLIEARLPPADGLPSSLRAAQIAAAQFAILEPWTLGQTTATAEAVADAIVRSSRALVAAHS